MTSKDKSQLARRQLDAVACYESLMDLFRAVEEWSTFFAGENPQDPNQHLVLVRQKRGDIITLSENIGEAASACLAELSDTVDVDATRKALNQSNMLLRVPANDKAKWLVISALSRASHLGWILSERGIKNLAHSDNSLDWRLVYQQDLVADLQVACRSGLENAGSILGKTEREVRKEMCPSIAPTIMSDMDPVWLEPDDVPILLAARELGAGMHFVDSNRVHRKAFPNGEGTMPRNQRERLKSLGLIHTKNGGGMIFTEKAKHVLKNQIEH